MLEPGWDRRSTCRREFQHLVSLVLFLFTPSLSTSLVSRTHFSLLANHILFLPTLSSQLVLDPDSTSPPKKEEESLECRVRPRDFHRSIDLKRGRSNFEMKGRQVVVEVGRSARFVREQGRSSRAGSTKTSIILPSLLLRTNSTRLCLPLFSSLLSFSSLFPYMRDSQLVYFFFSLLSSNLSLSLSSLSSSMS